MHIGRVGLHVAVKDQARWEGGPDSNLASLDSLCKLGLARPPQDSVSETMVKSLVA